MALPCCLRCAILKALFDINKVTRAHDARDSQSHIENVQSKAFEILKMFKNNFKFTRATC